MDEMDDDFSSEIPQFPRKKINQACLLYRWISHYKEDEDFQNQVKIPILLTGQYVHKYKSKDFKRFYTKLKAYHS